jgi:hypothetical protein
VNVRRVNPFVNVSVGAAPVNGFAPRCAVTVACHGAPAVTAPGVDSVADKGGVASRSARSRRTAVIHRPRAGGS